MNFSSSSFGTWCDAMQVTLFPSPNWTNLPQHPFLLHILLKILKGDVDESLRVAEAAEKPFRERLL